MATRVASTVLTMLFLAGCAATTPAPRFTAVSPADAEGPEAGIPPPEPSLAAEAEVKGPKPAVGHEGHPMAAPSVPGDEPYSCPMHPEVNQAPPGSCPKCGMQLVKRKDARPRP